MAVKSYRRNFFTILSGNTISQLVPFILAPILTRLFSPEEHATAGNFLAIVGVLGIIACGRLELAIAIPKLNDKAKEIAQTGLILCISITILSTLIPIFGSDFGRWYNDPDLAAILWLIPISVLSYGLLGISSNWNLRHEKFHIISYGKIAQSVFNSGMAALLGYLAYGTIGLVFAWLLSQFINIFTLTFPFGYKRVWTGFTRRKMAVVLSENKDFPLINSLHAFTDIFATQLALFWVITNYYGQRDLGIFMMTMKYVKAPIVLISSSVSQLFFVQASKAIQIGESILPVFKKTLNHALFFAVPFTLIIFFFGEFIFGLYLGDNWSMAGVYAKSLTPMLFFSFLISPVSTIPILFKRQMGAFFFSILGYTLTLSSLILSLHLKLSFQNALYLYSTAFCIYYGFIMIWYIKLIRRVR